MPLCPYDDNPRGLLLLDRVDQAARQAALSLPNITSSIINQIESFLRHVSECVYLVSHSADAFLFVSQKAVRTRS